jgi:hypothetical protein
LLLLILAVLLPPAGIIVYAGIKDRGQELEHVKDAMRTPDFSPGEYIGGRVNNVPSISSKWLLSSQVEAYFS